jgi:hypothetical protein
MGRDNEPLSPIEASLQNKFEEALKLQRSNKSENVILQSGFVYFDSKYANLNGEFQIVANSVTGKTLIDIYKEGLIPGRLIRLVDSDPHRIGEGLARLLTHIARVLPEDRFRECAKDLGIPEAENLKLYTMKDNRSVWKKYLDAWNS